MATNGAQNIPTAASGKVLQGAGVGTAPVFSTATYPATAGSTGTILRADGTNWVATTNTFPNTATTGDILYASGSNVIGNLADVAVGQVLTSGGVGAVPAYSATPTVTSITFGAGSALSTYVAPTSFQPTITGSTGSGTVGYAAAREGRYARIGDVVTYQFVISGTITGSPTGDFQVSLPITSANISNCNNYGVAGLCKINSVFITTSLFVGANSSLLTFQKYSDGTNAAIAAGAYNVQGTITYFAA